MTPEWVPGVDASYDLLTPEIAQALKASGIQVFAQCLWTGVEQPANRGVNLRNALEAGLAIIGYISIAPGQTGAWHVVSGRAGLADDLWAALIKVPIDVELAGLTFVDVQSALRRVALLGKPQDIYCNYNTWVNVLGNPLRPYATGLWNALWNNDPANDFKSLPYGGWQESEVWGEQYTGASAIEGLNADSDIFRAAALGIGDSPMPIITEKDLRMALIRMLAAGQYLVQPMGSANALGQAVAKITLADGSDPDPAIPALAVTL